MAYFVQPGDTLWSIAKEQLGTPARWPEIAALNGLQRADELYVGQVLFLPPSLHGFLNYPAGIPGFREHEPQPRPAKRAPGRAFMFVLADEINPFTKKVVRKVLLTPELAQNPTLLERVAFPEKYGFSPIEPGSKVSLGRHVLGMTDSRFISASERLLGSPRFPGTRYWIDVDKAAQAGATFHDGAAIAADLDRIAAKSKPGPFLDYIETIRKVSAVADREVVFEGSIPASAIKGPAAMGLTRGLQFVQGVGIVMSAYDLGKAGAESVEKKTVKPIAAESVRQVGGWAGAAAGAKIGGALGAAVGIETGPGAILTGLAGAIIFGAGGYFGADWVADHIYEN